MPLTSNTCTPIDDQRCTSLASISQWLLAKTYEAVSSCFNGGCDGEITAYITTGQGDDGVVDALTVALLQIDVSPLTVDKGVSKFNATFEVRLRESGWPVVHESDGQVTPPAPAEQAAAVSQLLAHGEAIHRRLSAMKSSGTLVPPGQSCLSAQLGALLPVFPQGGVAGWSILVVIQAPWN